MKKIIFLVVAVSLAIFANASDVVLNPRGWKVGDSRSYKCVTVDKQGNIVNHDISMKVNSMNKDKYFIDFKNIIDTTSNQYLGVKKLFGEQLARDMNEFVYKVSFSKQGEFGNFENYKDLRGLFGGGMVESIITTIIGTSQQDAENKYLPEIQNIFWYMNKKFDENSDNIVKRNFTEKISIYKDVEANVKVESSRGKLIFTLTANLSEEEFFLETEKSYREMMNNMAKSMGVQPSMFEDKVKEQMDELKKSRLSAVIKEKAVFDEKTGWLISYDRVMETNSAATGETFIESRCTISEK
ncbi:MAG: hypothetical protein E7072_02280 [Bacteroidales bacterium]|nr:hypothetical protein [Bacteroidales bacterium]